MAIEDKTKREFLERAASWMKKKHSKFFNWALGEVKPVKGARQPDGLVVPILCASCGNTFAHYDELPELK